MKIKTKVMYDGTNGGIVERTHPDFDNMTAVLVDAETEEGKSFSADCAAEITIENLSDIKAYFANYRYSLFWCRPFFGKDLKDVPAETQSLLVQKNDGTYEIVVAVTGDKYKCTLLGDKWGLRARVYSWFEGLDKCNTLAYVRGTGNNPYELLHKAFSFAVKMLGDKIKMREQRPYPEIFEYLGWCTCDAFYVKVSEEKILDKCREFRDKSIPVKWTIIDDIYADIKEFDGKDWNTREEMMKLIHTGRLYSFNASPVRFPNGLKHCIDEIKKFDMQVGVWHPTTAYWKGANPDGEVMRDHPDVFIQRNGYHVPGVKKEQMEEFYDAFHRVIKQAGAHFLKIDNQSCIDQWYKGTAPVGEIASNLHGAIEKSVYKYFDGRLINCMCMSSENMWNRPETAIARCSNDFIPENREWFTNHITQCAYNCLTQGQLVWCDWDMWWTDDGQATKNSLLRAISGGPIYVSDTSGRSRREVFMPLCLYNGRILRTDIPATPTFDCIFTNPETSEAPFKVWSKSGEAYYIAVFDLNRDNRAVNGSVSICDANIHEAERAQSYLVTEQFTGKSCIVEGNGKIDILLAHRDEFRLFKFVPINDGFALAGLDGKFISTLTAKNVTSTSFTLLEGGDFSFYSERKPEFVKLDGVRAEVITDGVAYKVKCGEIEGEVEVEIVYG